jgi:hypothetical protein
MATTERADREVEELRCQLAHERAQLVADLAALRDGASPVEAARLRLPLLAPAALAAAFVLAGGIGATVKLFFRRGRERRRERR